MWLLQAAFTVLILNEKSLRFSQRQRGRGSWPFLGEVVKIRPGVPYFRVLAQLSDNLLKFCKFFIFFNRASTFWSLTTLTRCGDQKRFTTEFTTRNEFPDKKWFYYTKWVFWNTMILLYKMSFLKHNIYCKKELLSCWLMIGKGS